MTIDEANEIMAKRSTAKLPEGDNSAIAHFNKALYYDAIASAAQGEQKKVMATKACDKHLNVAAALETLGQM